MHRIRILIAEDDDAAREALERLLGMDDSLEVVGAARDAREAVSLAAALRPDVALVDVKMPGGGGPVAARGILRHSPATRVVALSAYTDRETVLEMVRAGATGYVAKGAAGTDIVSLVRQTVEGGSALSMGIAADLVRELADHLDREGRHEEERKEKHDRILSAIERGAIRPVFQPIMDLRTDEAVGFEALSRFSSQPTYPPNEWFSDAIEVGLGPDLELAALRAALRVTPTIPLHQYVSINISPEAVLSPDFERTLARIPTSRAVIELTEHARVDDYGALRAAVDVLTEQGGRLAIDDVGAGFASLTHILKLNPDIIKLDVSLTKKIDTERPKRALATALISFASEIDATVVAEGIETPEELEALRELDVAFGQGYHLGRPVSLPVGGEELKPAI